MHPSTIFSLFVADAMEGNGHRATGPQLASKIVLLNYISYWNVLALFQLLRKRHHAVSIAIVGSILVKLMTVFSTDLFSLQLVSVENPNTLLIATDKFDRSNYNSKFVDARPTYATFGKKILNMSYPPGTTSQYAIQPFNTSTRKYKILPAIPISTSFSISFLRYASSLWLKFLTQLGATILL